MQSSKNAMAVATETVANIGASAKSGLDKTKAVVEEKVEKLTAHHPVEKETAERLKEAKVRDAEIRKREAMEQNAAAREQVRAAAAGHVVGGPVEVTTAQNLGPPGGTPGQMEIRNREAVEQNAAARDQDRAAVPADVTTAQNHGPPGRIPEQVESGVVGSRLIGRSSAAHIPRAGSA